MKKISLRLISIIVLVLSVQLIVSCESENNDSDLLEFEKKCMEAKGAELCSHRYALCIAASCDPSTTTDTKIECGHCDKTDGSCGYCYVFEGKSCSYNAACSDVQPSGNIVYSTYSELLSDRFGFDAIVCDDADSNTLHAGCMDAPCTLTGDMVSLTDMDGITHEIPTAICECNVKDTGPKATLGGHCNKSNCSAIWSTADDHARGVLETVTQCSVPNQ